MACMSHAKDIIHYLSRFMSAKLASTLNYIHRLILYLVLIQIGMPSCGMHYMDREKVLKVSVHFCIRVIHVKV